MRTRLRWPRRATRSPRPTATRRGRRSLNLIIEVVAAVAAVAAAQAEGIGDRVLSTRTVVFVPGKLDEQQIGTLVDAFGPQRLTVIGVPGSVPLARLQELGVARCSYGPWSQRVALTALEDLVHAVHGGGGLPAGTRPLN